MEIFKLTVAITLLIICMFAFASLGKAQTVAPAKPLPKAPTSYSVARTDTNTIQQPNPMPKWGPTGIGQKFCNKDYNNICIVRLTDSTTFKNKGTAQAVESGKENPFSIDDRFVMVATTNGPWGIVSFDPKSEKAGTLINTIKNGPGEFSFTNANTIFQRANDTQVMKLITKDGWKTYTSTLVYDFINCLPAGINITWGSSWSISNVDTSFGSAFSDRGPQGSGEWVVAFKKGVGCSSLNTLTGMVTNWEGKEIGTIDDGTNPLPDRFVMHEAALLLNSNFMNVGVSQHDNGKDGKGSPGCKAGGCDVNGPYYWEVGTTHLRPCGLYKGCDGHVANGYEGQASGKKGTRHYYSNPSQPLLQIMNLPNSPYDFQGSWNNSDGTDDQPAFGVTADASGKSCPLNNGPYENEIFAAASDGSKMWRFGSTLTSCTSQYYICQNNHMAPSADGKFILFSTDAGGNGALGFEADGVTSRCDVFIMEAK